MSIVKRQTAAGYLQKLVSEGILKEIEIGREKIYINTRFMQILFKETDSHTKLLEVSKNQQVG